MLFMVSIAQRTDHLFGIDDNGDFYKASCTPWNTLIQTWNMAIKSRLFKLYDSLCIYLKTNMGRLRNHDFIDNVTAALQ